MRKALIVALLSVFLLSGTVLAFTGIHKFRFVSDFDRCPSGTYKSYGKFPYNGFGVFDWGDRKIKLIGYLTCDNGKEFCAGLKGYFETKHKFSGDAYLLDKETCSKLILHKSVSGKYYENESGYFLIRAGEHMIAGKHTFN